MRKHLILGLCLILISNTSSSFAKTSATEGFHKLIQKYGAYEALEEELSKDKHLSPELILELAKIKFLLNKPTEVLSLLQQRKFSGKVEGKRLLLLGDTYRLLGNFKQSLIYYAKARNYLTTKEMVKLPQFQLFWNMGIRKWIWQCIYYGECLSNKGELSSLENVVLTGGLLWRTSPLWSAARKTCALISQGNYPVPLVPSSSLRSSLVKFFAYISLSDYEEAKKIAQSFPKIFQRQALLCLLNLLEERGITSFSKNNNIPKLNALVELLPSLIKERFAGETWGISYPEGGGFGTLRKELLSLPPQKALSILKEQISSPLISSSEKEILRQFQMAFGLIGSDEYKLEERYSPLFIKKLPLSLKISLLILNADKSFAFFPAFSRAYTLSMIVLQPFGIEPCHMNSSFFDISPSQIDTMIKKYPLDMLLYYCYLKQKIEKKASDVFLKAMAFLFPDTLQGKEALISLAQLELKKGNLLKATAYLKMIKFNYLTQELVKRYYLTMAELMEKEGQKDAALSYYKKLLELSPSLVPPIKFLKIALYAQQIQKWKEAQQFLLYLWNNKEKLRLSREMQAEVLFWLAEGDQQLGKEDKAIERYLKVYWFYKDQYIWSITALYRTGLIYERRGNLIVARRIFKDVLKNARRKSEKQAAKARLKAINQFNRLLSSSPYLF